MSFFSHLAPVGALPAYEYINQAAKHDSFCVSRVNALMAIPFSLLNSVVCPLRGVGKCVSHLCDLKIGRAIKELFSNTWQGVTSLILTAILVFIVVISFFTSKNPFKFLEQKSKPVENTPPLVPGHTSVDVLSKSSPQPQSQRQTSEELSLLEKEAEIKRLTEALALEKAKNDESSKILSEKEQKAKELEEQLLALQKEYTLKSEAHTQLEKTFSEKNAEQQEINQRFNEVQSELFALKNELKKRQAAHLSENQEADRTKRELGYAQSDIEALNRRIESLNKEKAALKRSQTATGEALSKLKKEQATQTAELTGLREKEAQLIVSLRQQKEEITRLKNTLAKTEKDKNDLTQECSRLGALLEQAIHNEADLKGRLSKALADKEKLSQGQEDLRRDRALSISAADLLQEQTLRLESEKSALVERLERKEALAKGPIEDEVEHRVKKALEPLEKTIAEKEREIESLRETLGQYLEESLSTAKKSTPKRPVTRPIPEAMFTPVRDRSLTAIPSPARATPLLTSPVRLCRQHTHPIPPPPPKDTATRGVSHLPSEAEQKAATKSLKKLPPPAPAKQAAPATQSVKKRGPDLARLSQLSQPRRKVEAVDSGTGAAASSLRSVKKVAAGR